MWVWAVFLVAIGLIITCGLIVMAALIAGSRADDQVLGERQYEIDDTDEAGA